MGGKCLRWPARLYIGALLASVHDHIQMCQPEQRLQNTLSGALCIASSNVIIFVIISIVCAAVLCSRQQQVRHHIVLWQNGHARGLDATTSRPRCQWHQGKELWYCRRCSKENTPGHVQSDKHKKK